LSETREMHWCEYHLINKGRALTANGNEALIDLTVQMSPSIHKLRSVSALPLSGTTQPQARLVQNFSQIRKVFYGDIPRGRWKIFIWVRPCPCLTSPDRCPRKKPVIQRYEFYSLFKALDSFFYHATDLNEVFFNPWINIKFSSCQMKWYIPVLRLIILHIGFKTTVIIDL